MSRAVHIARGRRSARRVGDRMNESMSAAPRAPCPATRFVNEAPTGACRALTANAQSRRRWTRQHASAQRMLVHYILTFYKFKSYVFVFSLIDSWHFCDYCLPVAWSALWLPHWSQVPITIRKSAIGKAANGRHSSTYTVSKSLRIFLSFITNARLVSKVDT